MAFFLNTEDNDSAPCGKSCFVLQDLRVGYGKKEIVHGVSLKAEPGNFCALLGLNGSGKTTILKCVCGLVPSMSGKCEIGGVQILNLNEKQRAHYLSYIPQKTHLPHGFSAKEIVSFGFNAKLSVFESVSKKQKEQALQHLESVGLGDLAENDVASLSGGQQQLIVLARCIAQDSPVMLMDEPDSALDFNNKHLILSKISNLIHERKKVGLITLHDPNFAFRYCDTIFVLKAGRIISEINMHSTSCKELKSTMCKIYDDADIIEFEENRFMLVKKS